MAGPFGFDIPLGVDTKKAEAQAEVVASLVRDFGHTCLHLANSIDEALVELQAIREKK